LQKTAAGGDSSCYEDEISLPQRSIPQRIAGATRFGGTGRQAPMVRADLFVALLLAGAAPVAAEAAGVSPLVVASGDSFNRPIDLSAGFRPPHMPPAGEDALPAAPRESETSGIPEPPAHPQGMSPRSGLPPIINKREHMATFRLQGVTLFGGSVAGSVDGRSAHILLSWPTDH
jgi:hypothetical protein